MIKNKLVANLLALLFFVGTLVGALCYYNFVDKPPVSSVTVGEECPNFIAKPYEVTGDTFSASNDVYTLVKQRGKVCVINFWETWCQGCIEELPEFNEIQVEYGDEVEVVAVVGTTSTIDVAAKWMTEKTWKTYDKESDWADFSLTFAYLPPDACKKLGCSGMLPRTIVVDREGVTVYEKDGKMTYQQLKELIDPLL